MTSILTISLCILVFKVSIVIQIHKIGATTATLPQTFLCKNHKRTNFLNRQPQINIFVSRWLHSEIWAQLQNANPIYNFYIYFDSDESGVYQLTKHHGNQYKTYLIRSRHQRCSVKEEVLKNFKNFTAQDLCCRIVTRNGKIV